MEIFAFIKEKFPFVKFLWERLQKKLLYKHYSRAHEYSFAQKFDQKWEGLTPYLEYKLYLDDEYTKNGNLFSKLLIKPINYNLYNLNKIDLSFVAQDGDIQYVQNIIHYFDCDKVIIFNLTNIPLIELSFIQNSKNNHLYVKSSFKSYYIRVNELFIDHKIIHQNVSTPIYNLTHFRLLNGEFTTKWNECWDLSFYMEAKHQLKLKILASFLEDISLYFNVFAKYKKTSGQKIRLGLVKFLTMEKVLDFLFWATIVLHITYVTDDGNIKSKFFSVDRFRKILRLKK